VVFYKVIILRFFLKKLMGSEKGKLAMCDHAIAVPDEMRQIAIEFSKSEK